MNLPFDLIMRVGLELLSENIIWYRYKEKETVEYCAVCHLRLINNDHCRISDCSHQFHADCIARYCDRVDNQCPICQTEVLDKLASFEQVQSILKSYKFDIEKHTLVPQ